MCFYFLVSYTQTHTIKSPFNLHNIVALHLFVSYTAGIKLAFPIILQTSILSGDSDNRKYLELNAAK